MSENQNPQGGPSGEPNGGDPKDGEQPKTFTQEEVNKLVGGARTDERRKVSDKFADYDDLKSQAAGKKTSDQMVADLQQRIEQSETKALRAQVAAEFGISTKRGDDGPSDAELFLTGTDEETLVAQAKRLAAREEERKKNQPYVSREGGNPRSKPDSTKAFLNALNGQEQ